MKRRIRVQVRPGMFSTERAASFEARGKKYTVLADKDFVKKNTLEVRVVSENGEDVLIDLPGDVFPDGNRILFPKSLLLPA